MSLRGGTVAVPTSSVSLDEVAPVRGMALLFQHQLLHEGCAVKAGVKYVLRSDVMYAD